jgi:hypothetical protein
MMLTVMSTALYRGDRSPISVFLEKTRFILQTLAGHAQEIEQIITLKFGNSLETMPKGTRHITLLYHQVRFLKHRRHDEKICGIKLTTISA